MEVLDLVSESWIGWNEQVYIPYKLAKVKIFYVICTSVKRIKLYLHINIFSEEPFPSMFWVAEKFKTFNLWYGLYHKKTKFKYTVVWKQLKSNSKKLY